MRRMRTMRKEYNSFTDLASRSGFGWDPIKQTITSPPLAWIELLADPDKVKQKMVLKNERPQLCQRTHRRRKGHMLVWQYVCEQVMKIEGFTKRYLRKAYTILMRNPIEKEIFLGGDLELKQEMV
ncbi:hypothetical protein IFM89_020698 [Coptis chinensis]|uniref:Myb/SANT-like domain-containing protein n=1 Tax=Coptis chinensis TaxID=261450 RepID=A0A835HA32_9MAGN|nr:hypothetical protein IFM89_020698 [Coptis chinensis]